jgi:hypothetical protein
MELGFDILLTETNGLRTENQRLQQVLDAVKIERNGLRSKVRQLKSVLATAGTTDSLPEQVDNAAVWSKFDTIFNEVRAFVADISRNGNFSTLSPQSEATQISAG